MAAYMPQRIFELAATSVVKAHIENGRPVTELAERIWEGYSRAYADDHVAISLVFAANAALDTLKRLNANDCAALINDFQYYAANFEIEGAKRTKWKLRKAFLDRTEQNLLRKQIFLQRLRDYRTQSKDGKAPKAPAGWTLAKQ